MGQAEVPTLHSYAVGQHDGKFLFINGRTNGLHGFDGGLFPENNFPPQHQNREVWVIDFVTRQTWSRPLDDPTSGLSEPQILSLSQTNNQFYGSGNKLYMTGGYGVVGEDEFGPLFGTWDLMTVIDLPGLMDWVVSGAGTAAQHIRQLQDPLFQVTGGAMYAIGGRTHLVFGQNFEGVYTPFTNGIYTHQVRSFDIVDDGVSISIQNVAQSNPEPEYRRRDLNVYPTVVPDGDGVKFGLTALSGVFTPTDGVWTVPVEIDAAGNPSMIDPNDPAAFHQGMNNYHSAKMGLYSESRKQMHELLFGGISAQFFDPNTQSFVTDLNLPFVNDITAVVVVEGGSYSQHHIGFFPELLDPMNRRLRFGTNAEFMLAAGIPTFENGVIRLDELQGETILGYIFGGIVTNAPHVRANPALRSAASNHVFAVVIIPVPEPSSLFLLLGTVCVAGFCQSRTVRSNPPRPTKTEIGCSNPSAGF